MLKIASTFFLFCLVFAALCAQQTAQATQLCEPETAKIQWQETPPQLKAQTKQMLAQMQNAPGVTPQVLAPMKAMMEAAGVLSIRLSPMSQNCQRCPHVHTKIYATSVPSPAQQAASAQALQQQLTQWCNDPQQVQIFSAPKQLAEKLIPVMNPHVAGRVEVNGQSVDAPTTSPVPTVQPQPVGSQSGGLTHTMKGESCPQTNFNNMATYHWISWPAAPSAIPDSALLMMDEYTRLQAQLAQKTKGQLDIAITATAADCRREFVAKLSVFPRRAVDDTTVQQLADQLIKQVQIMARDRLQNDGLLDDARVEATLSPISMPITGSPVYVDYLSHRGQFRVGPEGISTIDASWPVAQGELAKRFPQSDNPNQPKLEQFSVRCGAGREYNVPRGDTPEQHNIRIAISQKAVQEFLRPQIERVFQGAQKDELQTPAGIEAMINRAIQQAVATQKDVAKAKAEVPFVAIQCDVSRTVRLSGGDVGRAMLSPSPSGGVRMLSLPQTDARVRAVKAGN